MKLIKKQGKEISELFEVVDKLANGQELEEKYKNHPLAGNYKGFKECHIEPDLLLIYKYYKDVLVLSLVRVGSHSRLFNK